MLIIVIIILSKMTEEMEIVDGNSIILISWMQSPSAVILEPKKIKPDTVSTVSPSISLEVMGPGAMIFVF